jgi:LacI family transcriptional regulator
MGHQPESYLVSCLPILNKRSSASALTERRKKPDSSIRPTMTEPDFFHHNSGPVTRVVGTAQPGSQPHSPEHTRNSRPRVALLIESSRAYGRGLLLGVARYIRAHGPWSIFLQERGLGDLSPGWLEDWAGDGIIARIESWTMADAIRRLRLPTVDLRNLLPNLNMPCVRTDDSGVARLAADHLLDRGFRHFAFCGFDGADYSDIRRDDFAQRIRAGGFQCHVFVDPRRPQQATTLEYEEHGLKYEDLVARWLAQLPKPAGLMACNDIRGQQVINACRAIGVAVPDDVAVIGVDNDEVLCDLSDPPLTSVMPNAVRIGYEAAALLDGLMAGKAPSSQPLCIAPSGVMTRRSTDVLAVEDRHIAATVRFIREHACEGIDMSDILRVVPLSRSTLERRFVKALGRSPKDEILRVRLNRAKQLLAETDFTLPLIAEKVGFEHPEYLSVIFKKKKRRHPGPVSRRVAHRPDGNALVASCGDGFSPNSRDQPRSSITVRSAFESALPDRTPQPMVI